MPMEALTWTAYTRFCFSTTRRKKSWAPVLDVAHSPSEGHIAAKASSGRTGIVAADPMLNLTSKVIERVRRSNP